MPITLGGNGPVPLSVEAIAVVGPGIVGMPMAALLARAAASESNGVPAFRVVVVQRPSATSGWKVDAINSGQSPIGGIEPELDTIIAESVATGALSATHDYTVVADADVVLVCVQTDRDGWGPAYGPLFEALDGIADALAQRSRRTPALVIIESTLAPTSMATVVRDRFERNGLREGVHVLLGNSPNRVMPGRLVERVRAADKLVAGLQEITPDYIADLYGRIVTEGRLHRTNSLTAEIVKTLENAYRDVRIAYAAEVARYCDDNDIDFSAVRRAANERLAQVDAAGENATAVPTGALLIPTIGVGGHCLPKDGILLWWRRLEAGSDTDTSLILESRRINDESPSETIRAVERAFGPAAGRRVALLGAAYRPDSEDTRNSPSLVLARQLVERGCTITLHDPHVRPHDYRLSQFGVSRQFTRDLAVALADAELAIICVAHAEYVRDLDGITRTSASVGGVFDGCNAWHPRPRSDRDGIRYAGIGWGTRSPDPALIDAVVDGFRAVERGVANELQMLIDFFNTHFATDTFTRVQFDEVQRLAGTCLTGCQIAAPGAAEHVGMYEGFASRLVERATVLGVV